MHLGIIPSPHGVVLCRRCFYKIIASYSPVSFRTYGGFFIFRIIIVMQFSFKITSLWQNIWHQYLSYCGWIILWHLFYVSISIQPDGFFLTLFSINICLILYLLSVTLLLKSYKIIHLHLLFLLDSLESPQNLFREDKIYSKSYGTVGASLALCLCSMVQKMIVKSSVL